jgi:hypothetical protein
MKTSTSQCLSESRTHGRVRRASAVLPLALLVMSVQVAAQEQTAAVLKLQDVDFFYRSSVVLFSCSDLEGRVARTLRALGAREDIKVMVNGCDAVVTQQDEPSDTWQTPSRGSQAQTSPWQTSSSSRWQTPSDRFGNRRAGREQSAHIRVRLMMPVEVTPEVLAELEKDKSRRELVSRVTGNPAAGMNEPIVFPAQRQLVTLSRRTIDLEPEECELLEQMSTSVFRQLDIRVVGTGPRCDRDQVSHMPPQVTVEALMPVMPTGPQLPQLTPAEGESDPEPSAPGASDTTPSEPEPAPKPE